jgi:hypothetical protein
MTGIAMESDTLKLLLTPQYAGKIWRVLDKRNGKDLFFNNPAHQPANIGTLKAWAAGGIEWNWSPGIVGHSAFTESPAWVAKVPSSRGDILRVYEFDRYNATVWQVDVFLDNDTLWHHVTIHNPHQTVDLRGYWWTCVAHHAAPEMRIITPGNQVVQNSVSPFQENSWPHYAGSVQNGSFTGLDNVWSHDNSYLGNIIWGDLFLRIPSPQMPYIAIAEQDGRVVFHGHTLNGTKFFTWGQNGAGRFMQDFLSGVSGSPPTNIRPGDYTELQTGVAPTQMQTFPVPSQGTIQFTEWFKSFNGSTSKLFSNTYSDALGEMNTWLSSSSGMNASHIADVTSFLNSVAITAINASNILSRGSPWGGLYERLAKGPLTRSTYFDLDKQDPLVQPWVELMDTGTFSTETLSLLPVSYQVRPEWISLLAATPVKNMTWLHQLHLAIYEAELGQVDSPRSRFQASLSLNPVNPIAARCLARLSSTPADAEQHYLSAYGMLSKLSPADPSLRRIYRNLVTEICFFYQTYSMPDQLSRFIAGLPNQYDLDSLDAVLLGKIIVALWQNDPNTAISILSGNCFPTFGSDRGKLMT